MKTLIAVGQMTATENKSQNLAMCEALITRAAGLGAKFLTLPENFAYLGMDDQGVLGAAEPLDGPSITRLRKCAQKNAIWLSLGGFQELALEAHKVHNTHVIIDDQGELKARYRKMHLFSVTLPDGTRHDENRVVVAGEKPTIFKTPYFMGGLSICYDLRFAHLFWALRALGAQLLLVPAAFTNVTGPAHWEVLLRARAIETQCYVVAAAQVGQHNEKRRTHGHAMIVDPWGTIIAQCGDSGDIALAEIDLDEVARIREHMPLDLQRRPIG